MARVVSLTLFLLSWLLLFSYAGSYSTECQVCTNVVDHIYQQVQNNEAQICPKKVEKVFDHIDVADFDKLANRVCYDLYPDACSVTPSTKDGIEYQGKQGKQEIANHKGVGEKEEKSLFNSILHKAASLVRKSENR